MYQQMLEERNTKAGEDKWVQTEGGFVDALKKSKDKSKRKSSYLD